MLPLIICQAIGTRRTGGRLDPEETCPDDFVKSLRWVERDPAGAHDVVVADHGTRLATFDGVGKTRECYEDRIAATRAARCRRRGDNSREMVNAVRAILTPEYGSVPGCGNGLGPNTRGVIHSRGEGR